MSNNTVNNSSKNFFWLVQAIAILLIIPFNIINFIQPESGTFLNRLGWDLALPFILGTIVLTFGGAATIVVAFRKSAKKMAELIVLGILLILLATWWLIISFLPDGAFWLSRYYDLSV